MQIGWLSQNTKVLEPKCRWLPDPPQQGLREKQRHLEEGSSYREHPGQLAPAQEAGVAQQHRVAVIWQGEGVAVGGSEITDIRKVEQGRDEKGWGADRHPAQAESLLQNWGAWVQKGILQLTAAAPETSVSRNHPRKQKKKKTSQVGMGKKHEEKVCATAVRGKWTQPLFLQHGYPNAAGVSSALVKPQWLAVPNRSVTQDSLCAQAGEHLKDATATSVMSHCKRSVVWEIHILLLSSG